jgi:uncharacterized caspase-like protein
MHVLRMSLWVVAVLSTLALSHAQAPVPEPRAALVIGNSDYAYAPLNNPVHDARVVAEALGDAGFDVSLETNADQARMQGAVTAFGNKLHSRGGVGLFYFAGHGLQLAGENYLLPVGGRIETEDDIRNGALAASEVVERMAKAGDILNIVVLDACRNNPVSPAGTRGLSRIDSNARLFVSYSTSPGWWRSMAQARTAPTPSTSRNRSAPLASPSRRPSSAP